MDRWYTGPVRNLANAEVVLPGLIYGGVSILRVHLACLPIGLGIIFGTAGVDLSLVFLCVSTLCGPEWISHSVLAVLLSFRVLE